MQIKWGILILFLAFMAGCGPVRVAQEFRRDSVVVVVRDSVIFRDSVILVRVEEAQDRTVLPDTDTSRLSTRYADSEAYVSGGKLHHSLRNRSEALIPVEVKLPKYVHLENTSIIASAREIVESEKQLSRWQQFMQALGYVFLGGVAVWLAIRIRRLFV